MFDRVLNDATDVNNYYFHFSKIIINAGPINIYCAPII